MNYAITGAAGNISKLLVEKLLNAGAKVRVIGRNENHLKELVQAGADRAIGDLRDVAFLKAAFKGADAVYTMYPPNFMTTDLKRYHEQTAENYAEAIKTNGIMYVVNLSSIGAHLPQGAGPVSGLHRAEEILNGLANVNIKHLRPAYFYTNLMANIDMIKNMGFIGNNFSNSGKQFPIVDPADIAAVAAEELLGMNFSGHSVRYIASDETDTDEIAVTIGNAIGKPAMQWVKFTDEQAFEGLLQAGFSKEMAMEFVELGNAIDSGRILEDYRKQRPDKFGAVKLKDFSSVFAQVYKTK